MSSQDSTFHIISAIRYDPLLLSSSENSKPTLNFVAPSPFYMLVYHRDRLVEAAQHFEIPSVVSQVADGAALHSILLQHVHNHRAENAGKDEPLKLRILFDKTGKMTIDLLPIPPVPLSQLFPSSFDPPKSASPSPSPPHPAQTNPKPFTPSPLTGGALTLGPTDYLPKEGPPHWIVRLDTKPTPSSPVTLLKTTARAIYNSSRARALPENLAAPKKVEVMMYNECHELTEGSTTSLYLFRGGRWVTPPVGVPAGELNSATLKEGEGESWDEGEFRKPFAGRWGHSVRSAKVGAGGQRGTSRRWALRQGMCMEEPIGVDTVEEGEGVWVSNGVQGFGFGRVVMGELLQTELYSARSKHAHNLGYKVWDNALHVHGGHEVLQPLCAIVNFLVSREHPDLLCVVTVRHCKGWSVKVALPPYLQIFLLGVESAYRASGWNDVSHPGSKERLDHAKAAGIDPLLYSGSCLLESQNENDEDYVQAGIHVSARERVSPVNTIVPHAAHQLVVATAIVLDVEPQPGHMVVFTIEVCERELGRDAIGLSLCVVGIEIEYVWFGPFGKQETA
ncbi:hypothetical protein K491DRAFT_685457 [Lophiostoma macrostomum CBS 122681]|uniref:Uncharacterized protein n=1 Tax=Lophiostoma macrostomum CBS 122681 TaxID=1314788 RepID=A0A6A6SLJ5_9PLEO|nr:hypothetical protein K491DRAFT_685457 [Lophiostoma macrostomum CBS 122681]